MILYLIPPGPTPCWGDGNERCQPEHNYRSFYPWLERREKHVVTHAIVMERLKVFLDSDLGISMWSPP